jgi:hypothetical protein
VTVRPVLTVESERRLAAMQRTIQRQGGFGLHLIVAEAPVRDEVLRRLRSWEEAGKIPPLVPFEHGEEGSRKIEPALAAAGSEAPWRGWLIPDADALVTVDKGAAMEALNLARDTLPTRVAGPLILIVSPARLADLLAKATDLLDVRSTTAFLASEAAVIDLTKLRFIPKPLESLAAIERDASLLQEASRGVSEASASGLVDRWIAISRRFEKLMDRDDGPSGDPARESAMTALCLARRHGYLRGEAEALVAAAETAYVPLMVNALPEAERALELADKLALPLVRARAIIVRDRTLWLDGQVDAIDVDRFRSMAVEPLVGGGDEESLAKAWLALGTMLFARKELDAAVEALLLHALPVAQAGNHAPTWFSSAILLGQIAMMRGELDQAVVWFRDVLGDVAPLIKDGRFLRNTKLGMAYNKRGTGGDRAAAAILLNAAEQDDHRRGGGNADMIAQARGIAPPRTQNRRQRRARSAREHQLALSRGGSAVWLPGVHTECSATTPCCDAVRIAFDLDDTLIAGERPFASGLSPPGTLARGLCTEPLRKGTTGLLRELRRRGHEVWIYTSSMRAPASVRLTFAVEGLWLTGVVNDQAHREAERLSGLRWPVKYPPGFGIDPLVDDSAAVLAASRAHGFAVVHVTPEETRWVERVLARVSLLAQDAAARGNGEAARQPRGVAGGARFVEALPC